jgi:hypothetical protein
MSTIPTPASIPEVLDVNDGVMTYSETPESKAPPVHTARRLQDAHPAQHRPAPRVAAATSAA